MALLFPIYHAPVLAGEIQKENSVRNFDIFFGDFFLIRTYPAP